MARYRKKPVEIEAIQWVSDNIEQVYEMLGDNLIIDIDIDEDLKIDSGVDIHAHVSGSMSMCRCIHVYGSPCVTSH